MTKTKDKKNKDKKIKDQKSKNPTEDKIILENVSQLKTKTKVLEEAFKIIAKHGVKQVLKEVAKKVAKKKVKEDAVHVFTSKFKKTVKAKESIPKVNNNYTLTKTKIISGLQCKKKLWYDFHEPEKEEDSASFYSGNLFGRKLRELDKSGLDLSGFSNTKAVEETSKALKESKCKIIYEAAFIHEGILIRPDVLKKTKNGWELWEAKAVKIKNDSPEEIKKVYLQDIAIQSYVITSKINLTSSKLVCIDDKFIYQGDGNYNHLFKKVDLTEIVTTQEQKTKIKNSIEELKALAAEKMACPNIETGDHCKDPYPCPYLSRCMPKLDDDSYKILPNIKTNALKNYIKDNNVKFIQEVPLDLLRGPQRIVHQVHKNNEEHLNPELKNILKNCDQPFYFMDFETIQQFVPIINGTTSHEIIPFQWSVHKCEENENIKIEDNNFFLDFSSNDIERKFLESLLQALGTKGTIFVHNESTEIKVLERLKKKESCKSLEAEIDLIISRIKDSLPLAREYFYNSKMKGKYGIKSIIKSIPTDISYEEEGNIGGGRAAQLTWFKCTDPKISQSEKEKEKILLKKYCAKDTFALHDLIKYWMGS
jgi:hypothetical protein